MMRPILLGIFIVMALMPHAVRAETKTVVLAGGCFWCLEHDMDEVKGVTATTSGYAGGDRAHPTYQDYAVIDDNYRTGHIEVVEVKYDSTAIDYEQIIALFLRRIDPTDGKGQFCDRGNSYRPAIFYASEEEKSAAIRQIEAGEKETQKKFDIELISTSPFWSAEDYHQDYSHKNPLRYKAYRYKCGRDSRIEDVWGKS